MPIPAPRPLALGLTSAATPPTASAATCPSAPAARRPLTPLNARLLIHAAASGRVPSAHGAWHRLRARWTDVQKHDRSVALRIEVRDLHGQRFAVCADAPALTELPLPAGTYVVTATRGDERRGYTLTLQAGTSFSLHLDSEGPQPP